MGRQRPQVSVTLPAGLVTEVDQLAARVGMSRSRLMGVLLRVGIEYTRPEVGHLQAESVVRHAVAEAGA